MIGTFTSCDHSDERALAEVPRKALEEAAIFSFDDDVISPQSRALLSSFLGYMWDSTAPAVDLRLDILPEHFLKLLGQICNKDSLQIGH